MGYREYTVYFNIALFPEGVGSANLVQDKSNEDGVIYSELKFNYGMFNKYICNNNEKQVKNVISYLNKLYKINNDKNSFVEGLVFDKQNRNCFKCLCLISKVQNECGESDWEDDYDFDDAEELDDCLKQMIVPRECEYSDAHINIDGKSYTIQIEIEHYNEGYRKNIRKTKATKEPITTTLPNVKTDNIVTLPTNNATNTTNAKLQTVNTDKVTTTVITCVTTITTVNGVSTSSTVTTTEVK